jgi:hypothetical protein
MIKGFGLCALAGLALSAFVACSEGDDGDPLGTGGTAAGGTGGTTVTGGTTGSGGDTTVTGGTTGSGGETTTTGGTTGTGGEAGGGNTAPGEGFLFAADTQSWVADYSAPDGMKAKTTVEWTGAEGDPDAGAIKVTIPFTGTDQKQAVQVVLETPVDVTGKIVTAHVKLGSGWVKDAEGAKGEAKVYLKDSDNKYGNGTGTFIIDPATAGQWVTIEVDPSAFAWPADPGEAPDPTKITTFGIEFNTYLSGGAPADDANYETAVVYIDSVTYQ